MEHLDFKVVKAKLVQYIDGIKTYGYICRMLTGGTSTLDNIAEEAALNTSAHRAEIKMNLELALDAISRAL